MVDTRPPGYWLNYDSDIKFRVGDHEFWMRTGNNADKIGVPDAVQRKFKPTEDRDKFLEFIMLNAPVMRVRSHGNFTTFEFANKNVKYPLDAIFDLAISDGFGDRSGMVIVNIATKEWYEGVFEDFKNQYADHDVLRIHESVGDDTLETYFPGKIQKYKAEIGESVNKTHDRVQADEIKTLNGWRKCSDASLPEGGEYHVIDKSESSGGFMMRIWFKIGFREYRTVLTFDSVKEARAEGWEV